MADDQTVRWAWMRDRTPVTRGYVYLNAGFSGPLTTDVVDAMKRRIDMELEHGPTTKAVMDDRAALAKQLREATATMMGADADEIAITGNTTEGVNIGINGLSLQAGDRVVTTSIEHGSGMVPTYWTRQKYGTEVSIVPIDSGDGVGEIVERFDQAMGDSTKLVVLSEISYSTGQALPLAEITRMAHDRGATVVVDGAQTAGHIPIDVHALGVDAYAVPSHKWLCGPDGLGMLYVRRDRIADLDPVKVSGRAAASYDFAGHFEAEREKVTKFEVSTTSTPVVAGTLAAVQLYLDSGPQAVWDRVRSLTRYAEDHIGGIAGVELTGGRTEATRSGLFFFAVPGIDPGHLNGYLQGEAQVVCRAVRQVGSVRLSLHVYNTEAEVDRVAEMVARVAKAGNVPEQYQVASGPIEG